MFLVTTYVLLEVTYCIYFVVIVSEGRVEESCVEYCLALGVVHVTPLVIVTRTCQELQNEVSKELWREKLNEGVVENLKSPPNRFQQRCTVCSSTSVKFSLR